MQLTERQQLYLNYLKGRKTPIDAIGLGEHFARTPKSIAGALMPLIEAGLVTRHRQERQRSVAVKHGFAYYYEAVEKFEKTVSNKTQKFQYHNQFNLGGL